MALCLRALVYSFEEVRWHAGIQHAQMVEIDFNQKHAGLIDNLKKYRAWGQPFVSLHYS